MIDNYIVSVHTLDGDVKHHDIRNLEDLFDLLDEYVIEKWTVSKYYSEADRITTAILILEEAA